MKKYLYLKNKLIKMKAYKGNLHNYHIFLYISYREKARDFSKSQEYEEI